MQFIPDLGFGFLGNCSCITLMHRIRVTMRSPTAFISEVVSVSSLIKPSFTPRNPQRAQRLRFSAFASCVALPYASLQSSARCFLDLRKRSLFLELPLILFLLFQCLSTNAQPQESLLFGKIENSIVSSIAAEVLLEAYANLGIKIKVREFPAERALYNSNSGKTDGEVSRISGLESLYPNLVNVPVPVLEFNSTAFTKKHNFVVNGWGSLKPYTVAVLPGIKYTEARLSSLNVTVVPGFEQAFNLLARGRYDIFVVSDIEGHYQIKKHGFTEIRALYPPLETVSLYHYLHIRNAKLVPLIRQSLNKMNESGRIFQIRESYIGTLY